MEAALLLLILQGLLGAFDTLYYHELRLRLPSVATARKELKLHAVRDFLYAIIFGSLAWINWNGLGAWVLIGLLAAEAFMTLWDFLEEDRSRKVPPGERSMHAAMGLVYGALLARLLPEILSWSGLPSGFPFQDHGLLSWLLTLMALGVFVSGLRDVFAACTGTATRNAVYSNQFTR
jgi:uncharacterized protein